MAKYSDTDLESPTETHLIIQGELHDLVKGLGSPQGIRISPQIRELLRKRKFESSLHGKEKAEREALNLADTRFIVNKIAENFKTKPHQGIQM